MQVYVGSIKVIHSFTQRLTSRYSLLGYVGDLSRNALSHCNLKLNLIEFDSGCVCLPVCVCACVDQRG